MKIKEQIGAIIWRGKSPVDGGPIVAIMVGFTKQGSANVKTGKMIQVFILREDVHPSEALDSGEDASICGSCVHRRDPKTGKRTCYVRMESPAAVWRAFKRGRYVDLTNDLDTAAEWISETGRGVRLGAYGDPAMVPFHVWEKITGGAPNWTGYTHQWAEPWFDSRMLNLVMASTEGQEGPPGARTFRVAEENSPTRENEILCPNYTKGIQCAACGLCKGTSLQAKNIVIPVHGTGKKHFQELAVV